MIRDVVRGGNKNNTNKIVTGNPSSKNEESDLVSMEIRFEKDKQANNNEENEDAESYSECDQSNESDDESSASDDESNRFSESETSSESDRHCTVSHK